MMQQSFNSTLVFTAILSKVISFDPVNFKQHLQVNYEAKLLFNAPDLIVFESYNYDDVVLSKLLLQQDLSIRYIL